MHCSKVLALSLLLGMPSCLRADFDIQCQAPAVSGNPSQGIAGTNKLPGHPFGQKPKADRPGTNLLVPLFEIDTNDGTGPTTLFAIRNVTAEAVSVTLTYRRLDGTPLPSPAPPLLAPKDTLTVNIRDAITHVGDADGISRGFVLIEAELANRSQARGDHPPAKVAPGNRLSKEEKGILPTDPNRLITGDYFQVTSNQDFASGDRLLNVDANDSLYYDLCEKVETRFLNGGAFTGGSDLSLVAAQSGGVGPAAEATVTATIYDEAGQVTDVCQLFTDQFVTSIAVSELTDTPFGTVELTFMGTVGQVITEFTANNRFSVGMRGACKD